MNDDPLAALGPPKPPRIRIFTLMAEISAPLEGTMNDWPPRIQDGVLAALARKSEQVELPLAIVASWCDSDFHGHWYVYVAASEIIGVYNDAKEGYML